MARTNYTINIHALNELDCSVVKQALESQNPHIIISSAVPNGDNFDVILTSEQFKSSSIRVGSILDIIEKELFETDYDQPVSYKNYVLDWHTSILTIDNDSFQLSERERDVVKELIKAGDQGCSKSSLLNKVWGYRDDLETHALETHIYRLRQKIEVKPEDPKRLITIESGYILY